MDMLLPSVLPSHPSFPNDAARVLVAADSDEPGIAQPIFRRLLQELDYCNDELIQPLARGHLCGCESLAQAPCAVIRQTREQGIAVSATLRDGAVRRVGILTRCPFGH
jgi:hypothetical protein